MLFGDNMFVGNTAVDAAYLGNTQVWFAIPADVKAHIARVTADGGTVPEQAKMVSMVKKLMAANLWNNCVFFGLPLGGVKKDGNQYVSKVYDLKANADLLQATGTKQPKYQTNGSLLHDGADWLGSSTLGSDNKLRNTVTNKLTAIIWVKQPTTANGQSYFSRWVSGAVPLLSCYGISRSRTNKVGYSLSDGAVKRDYISSITMANNVWTCLAFTFDGTVMDGAKQGMLRLYVNGVEDTAATKTTFLDITTIKDCDTQVTIGTLGGSNNGHAEYTLINNSYTAIPQIYNSTFTSEQLTWNYNNIRPEGV